MEAKGNTSVAFALLCGLALCCAVMYISTDGEEIVTEAKYVPPPSIGSEDVVKAGRIYSNTPDGNMRLLIYFNKIEDLIAKETAERIADIKNIRANMAKNMAYNEKARQDMKKTLLHKMAQNAAQAKKDLHHAMRRTQAQFAQVAAHENKIARQQRAQFKATRRLMRKNKRAARAALRAATANQQRALSSLASTTNAHIAQTNKHIAANANQIATNAKKAQQDLENAMHKFQDKMANIRAEAKKGRSKLVAQAAEQDKKFRSYAANAVQKEVNAEAKRFASIRKTMAVDRAHADHMLKSMSTKMTAALNANAALNDKHFSTTVTNIKKAKKEADEQVAKAAQSFKMQTMQLRATATEQVNKLNSQQSKLAGTVESNRIAQAKVNHNVRAELKRMQKLGQKRYDEQVSKDKALASLIKKNRNDAKKKMTEMSDKFNNALDKARAQMAKDRAHAASSLKSATDNLHAVLAKNDAAQNAQNKKLSQETTRMAADAKDALTKAQTDFAMRLSKLHATAVKSAKRQQKKINKMTGIVEQDAINNEEGRKNLKIMADANRREIENAITDAINSGEARATAVEAKMKAATDKTASAISNKIDNDIAELRRDTQAALFKLSLESKAARAAMRKQVLAALSEAKAQTAKNLKEAVTKSTNQMVALNAKFEAAAKKGAAERAAMEKQIAADKQSAMDNIQNAMAAQSKALSSLKAEQNEALAATNKAIGEQEASLAKDAKQVEKIIGDNGAALNTQLENAKKAAMTQLAAQNQAAADRYGAAIKSVEDGVAAATKESEDRFGEAFAKMDEDRKAAKDKLAGATGELNDAIAQHAALMDRRFTHDLPGHVEDFKKASAARLKSAKKDFGIANARVLSDLKQSETRVSGDIMTVTGNLLDHKAMMARSNAATAKAIDNVMKTSNRNKSESTRFHKEIRQKVDLNKAAAHEEVKALEKRIEVEMALVRSKLADDRRAAATALTEATKGLSDAMYRDKMTQDAAMSGMKGDLATAQANTAAALQKAKDEFATSTNTLTNKITAANKRYEAQLKRVTGVAHNYEQSSKKGRARVRDELELMGKDMNKAIAKAIQIGEARMTEEQNRALKATDTAKRTLVSTIGEQVEKMADAVFATVNSNRQQIADNYVSLKAYAVAAADALEDQQKKKGSRNLAAVGDLVKSVAALSDIPAGEAEGVGAGADEIPQVFSGKKIKVANPVNKINFMVNEYVGVLSECKQRWPLGLGKYLLSRIDLNMQKKGILEVDKIEGKLGNFVFINAHSVGLSSKLPEFEKLAVKMHTYQGILKKLTAKAVKMPGASKGKVMVKPVKMAPPEWQGD